MTTATSARSPSLAMFEEVEPGFTSWDDTQEGDALAVDSLSVTRRGELPSTVPMRCSLDFFHRLLEFVEWEPGWDGETAEHVEISTARTAIEVAQNMLSVAAEPFVAPAPSGSLLLQWDFADRTSVEVYVDSEGGFPEWAALTLEGVVYEVQLAGPAALLSLLNKRAAIPPA